MCIGMPLVDDDCIESNLNEDELGDNADDGNAQSLDGGDQFWLES